MAQGETRIIEVVNVNDDNDALVRREIKVVMDHGTLTQEITRQAMDAQGNPITKTEVRPVVGAPAEEGAPPAVETIEVPVMETVAIPITYDFIVTVTPTMSRADTLRLIKAEATRHYKIWNALLRAKEKALRSTLTKEQITTLLGATVIP